MIIIDIFGEDEETTPKVEEEVCLKEHSFYRELELQIVPVEKNVSKSVPFPFMPTQSV